MSERLLYRKYKILGHAIFWIASITFMSLVFYIYSKPFNLVLIIKALITNVGFAIAVYTNLYLLLPKFLKKKSYIFYIFWLVLLLTSSSLFIQAFIVYPLREVLGVSSSFSKFSTDIHSTFFFATLFYVLVTTFLKFIKDWISMQDLNYKLAQIEKEKLEAELKSLKGQLNPHFLFNSLNNIYSLALTKSDKVPELILKLSDLMRHIIYESKENYIPLEKEIEFVDNFVALQKIRASANTRITYSKKGEIPSRKIAPLLFEPFIDNAFKHGLPGTLDPDFIDIAIQIKKDSKIVFKLKNNYQNTETWKNKNSGIGIENVKQRLKHLYKKDEYELNIAKDEHVFSVELQLNLK